MIDIFLLLGVLGLLAGVARYLFDRFKIPDSVLLMFIGMAVQYLHPIQGLEVYAPLIGNLALIILLFESGLRLEINALGQALLTSLGFTLTTFSLSVLLTTAVAVILGWPLFQSLLLAVIIGGTSSASVMVILPLLSIGEREKNILFIESLITDVLVVLTTNSLLTYGLGVAALGRLPAVMGISFLTALVFTAIGLLAIWRFPQSYSYTFAFGLMFILHYLTVNFGGNGLLAVFVFGLLLANAPKFEGSHLPLKIYKLHDEVSLFTRTFLFFYMGAITHLSPGLTGLLVLLAIYVARFLAIKLWRLRVPVWVAPRGLAAAALASSLPMGKVRDAILLIIIATNLLAALPQKKPERAIHKEP